MPSVMGPLGERGVLPGDGPSLQAEFRSAAAARGPA